MADRIVTTDRTPNWSVWRVVSIASVWEAVALSLGIDPGKVRHPPHAWMAGPRSGPIFVESQDFEDRLLMAVRHLMSHKEVQADMRDGVVNEKELRAAIYSLPEIAAWVVSLGLPVPPEFEEIARNHNRDTAPPANIFKTMDGLKWSEVAMTFIGSEEVRIRARGTSETFTYDAMGFKNQQSRTATPNMCWHTLRTLAIVNNTGKTLTDTVPPQTDFKRRVSEIRGALRKLFGIEDDPFPWARGGYRPAFTLIAEEHVIRHVRDLVAPDDEDEEDS